MAALTLTGLIPNIEEALDIVSREQAGFIRAVGHDASAEQAAKDQVIRSPVVGALASENLVAANVAADYAARTITYVDIAITKVKSVPFGITGEETLSLSRGGYLNTINTNSIAQAFRTHMNEIEADLAALHVNASRATGTATGTPFGTAGDLTDIANARQILEENGAPLGDLHMVLGSTTVNRIRGKQSNLFKVNEAGSDELLRTGSMGVLEGVNLHLGLATKTAVTPGTVTATVDATGYVVGSTSFTLSSAAVALLAGDIITFAGDANQYVVKTAVSGTGGTLVIQEPGIKVAMSTATKAITVVAATTRNMFFHRGALQLLTRSPAMPEGGDAADDVLNITDPVSGITFEFAVYKGKRQNRYEVNLAWGVGAPQLRHLGLLIGA